LTAELDCIPCILRQTVDSVHEFVSDPLRKRAIVNRVLNYLQKASLDVSPPEIGRTIHRMIKDITGINDPFKDIKQRDNASLLKMYKDLRNAVYKSSNPIESAAKLAIAGNIIDYGANTGPIDIQRIGKDIHKNKLTINHLKYLLDDLSTFNNVLYLVDNAGEIVFDKLFIESIRKFNPGKRLNITVVVRGEPVINDATRGDAYFVGMDGVANIIDNGDDTPGTLLKYCSYEMNEYFQKSDIIISKGQGNYETLDNEEKVIYFLLKAKCPLIARTLAVDQGALILKKTSAGSQRF
jgi:uncharacterized protein with ATP-grasp and redox domains